jgi:hypothetical protein
MLFMGPDQFLQYREALGENGDEDGSDSDEDVDSDKDSDEEPETAEVQRKEMTEEEVCVL